MGFWLCKDREKVWGTGTDHESEGREKRTTASGNIRSIGTVGKEQRAGRTVFVFGSFGEKIHTEWGAETGFSYIVWAS